MKMCIREATLNFLYIWPGNAELKQPQGKVDQITFTKQLDKREGFIPERPDLVVLGYHERYLS